MTKVSRFKPAFVESIPRVIEEGVLYISEEFETVSHKCPCGCGSRIVTPLTPTDWRLERVGSEVSLYPSVGNWSLPCRSHYWIRRSTVVWAESWSDAKIAAGRERDNRQKAEYFIVREPGLIGRIWSRLKHLFRI